MMQTLSHPNITISSFPNPFPGNPYLTLLYDHLERHGVTYVRSSYFGQEWLRANRGKVNFIHFHWVGGYYENARGEPSLSRLLFFLGKIGLARAMGYQVIWTMHNLYPHNKKRSLKEWLCRFLFVQMTTLIFINFPSAKRDLKRFFLRNRNVFLVPHGNYRPVYPVIPDRASARRVLGLAEDSYIFFLFGGIRPYKGAHRAIAAVTQIQDEQIMLVIMGQCLDENYQAELVEQATNEPRVRLLLGKDDVMDDQVTLWMAAIDCVLAPYEDIYTSGVLYLAATFGKPIITPRMGIFTELDEIPFIISYDPVSGDSLLRERIMLVKQADSEKIQCSAKHFANAHEWSDITRSIANILKACSHQ